MFERGGHRRPVVRRVETRALINAAAKAADATPPDFSRLIRIGLSGF
jgi:hypothetical protein